MTTSPPKASAELARNHAAAAADPRYVAPELVEATPAGPVLVAGKCKACGALSFPRAAVCTECLALDIGATQLSREGTLYSFSVVHQAPKAWTVPYVLGYVDLAEGIRVLAHIEGPAGDIDIDGKVRLDTARVGTAADGAPLMSYVFKPIKAQAGGSKAGIAGRT